MQRDTTSEPGAIYLPAAEATELRCAMAELHATAKRLHATLAERTELEREAQSAEALLASIAQVMEPLT